VPKARTYPNPATRSTTIAFVLRSPKVVNVEITDLSGKAIRTIEKRCESGSQEITWDGLLEDGSIARAGTYLYRVLADGNLLSGKLTVRR
jgi:flagellar hook assembly protein FlgD